MRDGGAGSCTVPEARARQERSRLPRDLGRLSSDRTHGARELAFRALHAMGREVRSWASLPPEARQHAARRLARRLADVQPAMGPFRAWSGELTRLLRSLPASAVTPMLRRWMERKRTVLREEPRRIATVVRGAIPPRARILTISCSRTVIGALSRLPAPLRPRRVLALESLPGGEGRNLVRELAARGLPARLIPDDAMGHALREVDLVVIGADAVEADGAVVHKVGTCRLARRARKEGVPLVVVAGRSKWVGRSVAARRLPRLFDRSPRSLVSAYWTDQGTLDGGRATGPPGARPQRTRSTRPRTRAGGRRR